MFGQYSAETAVCSLGVRRVCRGGGFILGLGSPCCRFHGPLYLLMAVSIFLEDGGEEFQFLCKGILVTESFALCIREERTDCLLAGWWWEFWCR